MTRLWDGDDFWAPACGSMADGLQRLQGLGQQNRTIEVVVKHYGDSLPDEDNYNATIWTYAHVVLHTPTPQAVPVFRQHCEQWFGELADAAIVLATPMGGWTDWVDGGQPVQYGNGTTILLPPKKLRGTAGGVRALEAGGGSVFTLWLVPTWELQSE